MDTTKVYVNVRQAVWASTNRNFDVSSKCVKKTSMQVTFLSTNNIASALISSGYSKSASSTISDEKHSDAISPGFTVVGRLHYSVDKKPLKWTNKK